MEEIDVCAVDALPRGERVLVKGSDGRNIAVMNVRGRLYAIDNACYHHGGPLLNGDIEELGGHHCVVCPWHSYRIALDTGEGLYYGLDMDTQRQCLKSKGVKQRVHEVKVVGGRVKCVVNSGGAAIESDQYALMPIANREDAQTKGGAGAGPKIHSGFALGGRPSGFSVTRASGVTASPWAAVGTRGTRVRCVSRSPACESGDIATFVFDKSPGTTEQSVVRPGMWARLKFIPTGAEQRIERQWTVTRVRDGCGGWFAITVKRVPGGQGSNWLHSGAAMNTDVEAEFGGDFTSQVIRPKVTEGGGRLLCLTAGIGITPIYAFIKSIADNDLLVAMGPPLHVLHAHSDRDLAGVAFRDGWWRWHQRFASKFGNASEPFGYRLEVITTRAGVATAAAAEPTSSDPLMTSGGRVTDGVVGRLVEHIAPDPASRASLVVMLCGPVAFMTATTGWLRQLGVESNRIFTERFD